MGPGPLPSSLRRLSLLEQRLQQADVGENDAEHDPAHPQLISQTLTAAASQAGNEHELEEHLRRLRAFGVASGADQIFPPLGPGLPDWGPPPHVGGPPPRQPPGAQVEAMARLISLPEKPIEMAPRF